MALGDTKSAPEITPTAESGVTQPIIFGCAETTLLPAEEDLFCAVQPLGFILFSRNCQSPDQIRSLVNSLKRIRPNAPILIDQEGGRVARLRPPQWRAAPPAYTFAQLARRNVGSACRAARLNARLIAADLFELGITVNCAPVLDVPVRGAHDIIGDRALGHDPQIVAKIGGAVCHGLSSGGVHPVIKHIPGHGRARADSHTSLPIVDAPGQDLRQIDFVPFMALANAPWAMTAHVVYQDLDSAPATLSRAVIQNQIRGEIGFMGLLISDDISMGALSGPLGTRATAALAAGCDVVLHCNASMVEMREIADAVSAMGAPFQRPVPDVEAVDDPPFNREETLNELNASLEPLTLDA